MPHASPLHETIRQAGANFAEYAGWELPADFGDARTEYDAAHTGAVLFDRSHTGKVEVCGPEAPTFLQNLCTNDIANLPLGGGAEAYFTDHRAKTLFQTRIYHVRLDGSRDALWIDVTPGYVEAFLKHLDRYLISEQAEFTDQTEQFAQLHLTGPKAKEVLEQALDDQLPDLNEFLHMERTFGAAATCSIRRRDPLGVPGYDLVCLNAKAEGVWRMLTTCGARPAGQTAFEWLRVEAGTPVYGIDIDDTRFVMEVSKVTRAVSYSKGCFLGQEPIVMARDRAGHVNRAFLGLKILEATPIPKGCKVFHDGQEVGVTTSFIHSPKLDTGLALGYLRRGHQDPGTAMEVETDSVRLPAEVVALPVV